MALTEELVNSAGPAGETIQVVEFLMGNDHYAINLFDVREVVDSTQITALPDYPTHIRGVIDLRGEITTIVDMKETLRLPIGSTQHGAGNRTSRIIVLDEAISRSKTGLLVDEVLSVSTYLKDIVDTTRRLNDGKGSHIAGIIRRKNRVKEHDKTNLIIWLDIRAILDSMGLAGKGMNSGTVGLKAGAT